MRLFHEMIQASDSSKLPLLIAGVVRRDPSKFVLGLRDFYF